VLRQVPGVGAITSLSFVLTLEDPDRFEKSRSVGAYLGLVPGKDQSGQSDPGRAISGEGDEMLRRLLVGTAPTTSLAPSQRTPTSGATARRSPYVAPRTPRNGP
jgi:transposase